MLKWGAYSAAGGWAILWISIWLFNGLGGNIASPVGMSDHNYSMGRLDYLHSKEVKCSVYKLRAIFALLLTWAYGVCL